MRGKEMSGISSLLALRITPAYAGKSTHRGKQRQSEMDHPRLCGEKEASYTEMQEQAGSPPPMRGKEVSSYTQQQRCGITPAYAGKSPPVLLRYGLIRDHPRLCGEKLQSRRPCENHRGSPPPMRGKGVLKMLVRRAGGITPAYAGKSRRSQEIF